MIEFRLDELPPDDFWLAAKAVIVGPVSYTHGANLPPADVLALLGPCETCGGDWGPQPHVGLMAECGDCVDGRPKFQIVVPCPVCVGLEAINGRRPDCNFCADGTVSRTFTVTGAKPLLPVRAPFTRPPLDFQTYVTNDSGLAFLHWVEHGNWDTREITVVGLDEHTTHALHVKEVP